MTENKQMSDLAIQFGISFAITLSIICLSGRSFYGAWPWEYGKTWYALKLRPRTVFENIPLHWKNPPTMTDDPHDAVVPSGQTIIARLAVANDGDDHFDRAADNEKPKPSIV